MPAGYHIGYECDCRIINNAWRTGSNSPQIPWYSNACWTCGSCNKQRYVLDNSWSGLNSGTSYDPHGATGFRIDANKCGTLLYTGVVQQGVFTQVLTGIDYTPDFKTPLETVSYLGNLHGTQDHASGWQCNASGCSGTTLYKAPFTWTTGDPITGPEEIVGGYSRTSYVYSDTWTAQHYADLGITMLPEISADLLQDCNHVNSNSELLGMFAITDSNDNKFIASTQRGIACRNKNFAAAYNLDYTFAVLEKSNVTYNINTNQAGFAVRGDFNHFKWRMDENEDYNYLGTTSLEWKFSSRDCLGLSGAAWNTITGEAVLGRSESERPFNFTLSQWEEIGYASGFHRNNRPYKSFTFKRSNTPNANTFEPFPVSGITVANGVASYQVPYISKILKTGYAMPDSDAFVLRYGGSFQGRGGNLRYNDPNHHPNGTWEISNESGKDAFAAKTALWYNAGFTFDNSFFGRSEIVRTYYTEGWGEEYSPTKYQNFIKKDLCLRNPIPRGGFRGMGRTLYETFDGMPDLLNNPFSGGSRWVTVENNDIRAIWKDNDRHNVTANFSGYDDYIIFDQRMKGWHGISNLADNYYDSSSCMSEGFIFHGGLNLGLFRQGKVNCMADPELPMMGKYRQGDHHYDNKVFKASIVEDYCNGIEHLSSLNLERVYGQLELGYSGGYKCGDFITGYTGLQRQEYNTWLEPYMLSWEGGYYYSPLEGSGRASAVIDISGLYLQSSGFLSALDLPLSLAELRELNPYGYNPDLVGGLKLEDAVAEQARSASSWALVTGSQYGRVPAATQQQGGNFLNNYRPQASIRSGWKSGDVTFGAAYIGRVKDVNNNISFDLRSGRYNLTGSGSGVEAVYAGQRLIGYSNDSIPVYEIIDPASGLDYKPYHATRYQNSSDRKYLLATDGDKIVRVGSGMGYFDSNTGHQFATYGVPFNLCGITGSYPSMSVDIYWDGNQWGGSVTEGEAVVSPNRTKIYNYHSLDDINQKFPLHTGDVTGVSFAGKYFIESENDSELSFGGVVGGSFAFLDKDMVTRRELLSDNNYFFSVNGSHESQAYGTMQSGSLFKQWINSQYVSEDNHWAYPIMGLTHKPMTHYDPDRRGIRHEAGEFRYFGIDHHRQRGSNPYDFMRGSGSIDAPTGFSHMSYNLGFKAHSVNPIGFNRLYSILETTNSSTGILHRIPTGGGRLPAETNPNIPIEMVWDENWEFGDSYEHTRKFFAGTLFDGRATSMPDAETMESSYRRYDWGAGFAGRSTGELFSGSPLWRVIEYTNYYNGTTYQAPAYPAGGYGGWIENWDTMKDWTGLQWIPSPETPRDMNNTGYCEETLSSSWDTYGQVVSIKCYEEWIGVQHGADIKEAYVDVQPTGWIVLGSQSGTHSSAPINKNIDKSGYVFNHDVRFSNISEERHTEYVTGGLFGPDTLKIKEGQYWSGIDGSTVTNPEIKYFADLVPTGGQKISCTYKERTTGTTNGKGDWFYTRNTKILKIPAGKTLEVEFYRDFTETGAWTTENNWGLKSGDTLRTPYGDLTYPLSGSRGGVASYDYWLGTTYQGPSFPLMDKRSVSDIEYIMVDFLPTGAKLIFEDTGGWQVESNQTQFNNGSWVYYSGMHPNPYISGTEENDYNDGLGDLIDYYATMYFQIGRVTSRGATDPSSPTNTNTILLDLSGCCYPQLQYGRGASGAIYPDFWSGRRGDNEGYYFGKHGTQQSGLNVSTSHRIFTSYENIAGGDAVLIRTDAQAFQGLVWTKDSDLMNATWYALDDKGVERQVANLSPNISQTKLVGDLKHSGYQFSNHAMYESWDNYIKNRLGSSFRLLRSEDIFTKMNPDNIFYSFWAGNNTDPSIKKYTKADYVVSGTIEVETPHPYFYGQTQTTTQTVYASSAPKDYVRVDKRTHQSYVDSQWISTGTGYYQFTGVVLKGNGDEQYIGSRMLPGFNQFEGVTDETFNDYWPTGLPQNNVYYYGDMFLHNSWQIAREPCFDNWIDHISGRSGSQYFSDFYVLEKEDPAGTSTKPIYNNSNGLRPYSHMGANGSDFIKEYPHLAMLNLGTGINPAACAKLKSVFESAGIEMTDPAVIRKLTGLWSDLQNEYLSRTYNSGIIVANEAFDYYSNPNKWYGYQKTLKYETGDYVYDMLEYERTRCCSGTVEATGDPDCAIYTGHKLTGSPLSGTGNRSLIGTNVYLQAASSQNCSGCPDPAVDNICMQSADSWGSHTQFYYINRSLYSTSSNYDPSHDYIDPVFGNQMARPDIITGLADGRWEWRKDYIWSTITYATLHPSNPGQRSQFPTGDFIIPASQPRTAIKGNCPSASFGGSNNFFNFFGNPYGGIF